MAFELIESAPARRRAVTAPHLVALVRAGVKVAQPTPQPRRGAGRLRLLLYRQSPAGRIQRRTPMRCRQARAIQAARATSATRTMMPILRGVPIAPWSSITVAGAAALFRAGAVAWPDAGAVAATGEAAITPAFTFTVAFALEGSVAVTVTRHSPLGSGSAEW
ncbi:hypothetical protein ETD86_12370 [Nonomuraea turkmeniaca]|uniref:Uncharacterized protein n=1 Tax=Nonomuraea turkmeniaca TaxID=103838 RepID=A0A5S4FNM1_9ACTN|nr:hypothetical protein ETD86_12370 [Nonomuraea turkmeniaca]